MFRITKRYVGGEHIMVVKRETGDEVAYTRRFLTFRTTFMIFWIIPIFASDELRDVNEI